MNGRLRFKDISATRSKERCRDDVNTFENTYKAEITNIHDLTETERLYRIQIIDPEERGRFSFRPGQFVMLEVPGIGEAPFSISSPPSRHGDIELCIRKVGDLTNFLSRTRRGIRVGLRGPFGTSFPMDQMYGSNVLLVAGGLGLAPLRTPVFYIQENRNRYKDVDIVYGAKEPSQLLFSYQYDSWRADDIGLGIIVEKGSAAWNGPVGLITQSLQDILSTKNASYFQETYAIVCGPPVMFKFVCAMLRDKDIPMQSMFVSLERRMHCGMGKCCRCNIGSTYTCLSGPVFDYWTVMNLKEAI